MGITELKKDLNKLDKAKLIDLFVELYKKNKQVKEYFDFSSPESQEEICKKYKKRVTDALYPPMSRGLNLKEGKKAITEFKSISTPPIFLADLMMHYVETGVQFTKDFGDINAAFYNSVAGMFHDALELMQKENLLEDFQQRAHKAVETTRNFGWGFYDDLKRSYTQFYPGGFDNNLFYK